MSSIINNAKNVGKNAGHNLVDTLTQGVTASYNLNTDFVDIRDFYNFIKSQSGLNIPTDFWAFSVCFYPYNEASTEYISLDKSSILNNYFFSQYESEFARFRYCIQQIEFPSLSIKGSDTGTELNDGYADISNMFGGYTILKNSYINAESHTLNMRILNTQSPVIENFVYPWMQEVLRTKSRTVIQKNEETPLDIVIPKVNIAVKYWGLNHLVHNMHGVKPDFVYYITGAFPVKINVYNPQQSVNNGNINRSVTFAFNDFVILNSYHDALKYNLFELFAGNAIDNFVEKTVNKINEKAHTFIDNLFGGSDDKDKNKHKSGSGSSNKGKGTSNSGNKDGSKNSGNTDSGNIDLSTLDIDNSFSDNKENSSTTNNKNNSKNTNLINNKSNQLSRNDLFNIKSNLDNYSNSSSTKSNLDNQNKEFDLDNKLYIIPKFKSNQNQLNKSEVTKLKTNEDDFDNLIEIDEKKALEEELNNIKNSSSTKSNLDNQNKEFDLDNKLHIIPKFKSNQEINQSDIDEIFEY